MAAVAFLAAAHAQDHRDSRIAGERPTATLAVVNGQILTMDSRMPRAEAMAVDGEWIVAAGTRAEVAPYIGDATEIIDADGRLVLPGFNDSHTHFSLGSARLRQLDLFEVDSLAEVQRRVAHRVAEAEPGEWIVGAGYDHTLWGTEWPTRHDLDIVAPENPVVLRRTSGHSIWVNSLAIERSGVTAETEAPAGGEIQKDPETGALTGIFLESAAGLIQVEQPELSAEKARKRAKDDLRNGFAEAARLGVTTIQSSTNLDELELLRELRDAGELTARFTGWLPLSQARSLAEQGMRSGQGDDWVRVGFLKGYIDGTLGDGTAAMFEPFSDREDFHGLPRMTQQEVTEAVIVADRLGFQIGIHAIGDKGVHMVLNAFEQAALRNGTHDKRHRIEHAQLIAPDDIRRFGQLGVVPSMQQTHCTTDMRFAETRVGYDRCKTAYAWRSLIDAGAVLAFGTDWPIEPLDPMRGLFSSVTRTNIQAMKPETGWFPEQKLTMWESIYYYTFGSAYAEHMENAKGTLAPGRLADFVVLENDLFRIPPQNILDTRVDVTVVGGRIVYRRE